MGQSSFPTTIFDPEVSSLIDRVRGEFRDMPGLYVTATQAARLCGLDASLCERLLAFLVDARFLVRGEDGRFRRPDAR